MLDIDKYGPWALVTGASSGIGEEFALRLAHSGFSVALVARRKERLASLSKRLAAEAPNVSTRIVIADLSVAAEVQRVCDETADLEVGLLVNNAGIEQTGSLWRQPPETQLGVLALHCQAPLMLLMHYGSGMIERRRGGVINISSRLAVATNPVCPLYCASKAFLSSLSVGVADQLQSSGVDMLVSQPGKTATAVVARAAVFNKGRAGVSDAMSVEAVVGQTLAALGRRAVVTPGWRAKLHVFMRSYLPRAVVRYLLDRPVLENAAGIMQVLPYSAQQ